MVSGISIANRLSDFGEEIVIPLTIKYKEDKDSTIKMEVLNTVNALIKKWRSKPHIIKLSDDKKYVLKELLTNALTDNNPLVRKQAVTGLGFLGDASVIPQLESIIKSDRYTITKQINGKNKMVMPVREKAKLSVT